MPHRQNLILAALPARILAALEPHLKIVKLPFAQLVASTGGTVTNIYFPHDSVVSLVVQLDDGQMVEAAMVGRDGVVNATSALDGKLSLQRSIVQVAGGSSSISPNDLRAVAREWEGLQSLIIRHEQILLSQAMQSAACNASHTVEARMCRWLLRIRDLTQSDQIMLTQEFLAQLLGVQRTSVSLVAGTLQSAGLIRYKRGNIKLLDIEALQETSCECYAKVNTAYEMLRRPGDASLVPQASNGRN